MLPCRKELRNGPRSRRHTDRAESTIMRSKARGNCLRAATSSKSQTARMKERPHSAISVASISVGLRSPLLGAKDSIVRRRGGGISRATGTGTESSFTS